MSDESGGSRATARLCHPYSTAPCILSLPAATTLHYAFKWLDTTGFEAALQAWAAEALGAADQQVVLDGKALRGIHGEELPGVRLVAVYAPVAGVVLAQAGGQDHRGAG